MYRKLKITKHSTGFSIIEAVIASALLFIAMIPILKCLTVAHANAVKIEHKSRSLLLAQAKLDEIKARSIYNYTNSNDSFAESGTSLDGSYLCNVTDNSGDPLKTIIVSVGFDLDGDTSLAAGEVNVALATLLARRWAD